VNRLGKRTIAAAMCLGTLWPVAANACAVCFSGSPRIRIAFFNTTILLSLLPLGMIFGGLWYLRRSGKLRLAEEFTESDYSLPEAPAPIAPAAIVREFPVDPVAPSRA
jgi:hypothetical protein